MLSALPVSPQLAARLSGSPLAIFLDLDGTLAPIAPRPDAARIAPATLAIIRELSRLANVHVLVVTGRSVADAQRLAPVDGIGVIGNHGFEILGDDGIMVITPEAHHFRNALQSAGARLVDLATRHHGLVVEDKTWTMSLHYRLAERGAIPEVTSSVENIASTLGLTVTRGKEVVELRPPIQVNKGTAVVECARRLHALDPEASVIYIGDDRTDEDAFHALRAASPTAVALRVGELERDETTSAEFLVETPDQVMEFLKALVAIRRRPGAAS